MKTIAISVFGDRISSRLDSSENLMLVTVVDGKVKARELFLLREKDSLKKIEIIIQLKPDVLICGGLTNICESKLRSSNIKVCSWVQGNAEFILSLCLRNKFIDGDYNGTSNKSQYRSQ